VSHIKEISLNLLTTYKTLTVVWYYFLFLSKSIKSISSHTFFFQ